MAFGACAPATAPPPPLQTTNLNDTNSSHEDIVKRTHKWLGISPSIAGSVALGLVVLFATCVLFARSRCSAQYHHSDRDSIERSISRNGVLDEGEVPQRLKHRKHSSLQSPAYDNSSSDDEMPRSGPSYNALRSDSNQRRKVYATVNNHILTSTSLFREGRAKQAHDGGRYRP